MKNLKNLYMVFAVVLSLSLMAPTEAKAQVTIDLSAVVQFVKGVGQDIQGLKTSVMESITNSKAFVAMGGAVKKAKAGIADARKYAADATKAKDKASGLKLDEASAKQISDAYEEKQKRNQELNKVAKELEDTKAANDKTDTENIKKANKIEEQWKDTVEPLEQAGVDYLDPTIKEYGVTPNISEEKETPNSESNSTPSGFRTSPTTSPGPQSFLRTEEKLSFAAATTADTASGSINGVYISSDKLMHYCQIKAVDDLKDKSVMISCLGTLGTCMNDGNHTVSAECKALYSGIMYDTVTNATVEIIVSKIKSSQFIESELKPLVEETNKDAEVMNHMASLGKINEMIQRRINELVGIQSTYIGVETLGKFNGFDNDAINEAASVVTFTEEQEGKDKKTASYGSIEGKFIASDTLMTYCELKSIKELYNPDEMISCIGKLTRCMNDENHRTASDCKTIYKAVMYHAVTNAIAEIIVNKIKTLEYVEKELEPAAKEASDSKDVMEHMASLGKASELVQKKLNELIEIQSTFIAAETLELLPGFDGRAVE